MDRKIKYIKQCERQSVRRGFKVYKNNSTEQICKQVLQSLVDVVVMRLNRTRALCCDVQSCPTRDSDEKVKFHYFPQAENEWVTVRNELGKIESIDRLVAWEKALQMDTSKAVSPTARRYRVCYKHFLKSDYLTLEPKVLKKDAVPFLEWPNDRLGEFAFLGIPNYLQKITVKEEPQDEPMDEIKEEPLDMITEELIIKDEVIQEPEPVIAPLQLLSKTPEPELPIRTRTPAPQQRTKTPEPVISKSTLCAVCLSDLSSNKVYNIHYGNTTTILKMLERCTGYQMDIEEQLLVPNICQRCYKELLLCYNYRQKYLFSQTILKSKRKKETCFNTNANLVTTDNQIKNKVSSGTDSETDSATESETIDDIEINVSTPLKCFEYYMDDVLHKITECTNQSIRKQATNLVDFPKPTCKEELQALVGLLVFSGSVKSINKNEMELYSCTIAGTVYESAISCDRFKFLLEEIKFYGDEVEQTNIENDDFTRFMHSVWNLFMDKCMKSKRSTAIVTRIEHYLICSTQPEPGPLATIPEYGIKANSWPRFWLPNPHGPVQPVIVGTFASHGIKMQTDFDSVNNILIKSYPSVGNGPRHQVAKCYNATIRNSFGQLWSSFYCSQNSERWQMMLFYAMLNITLINSYSMYSLRSVKISEEMFLKRLADLLIMPWAEQSKSVEKSVDLEEHIVKYRCYKGKKDLYRK